MLARFTMIFRRLQDVALYAERKEEEFSVRDGTTNVLAAIQRIDLRGVGDAQGMLDSGEMFNERNVRVRLDAPLGQSHRWVDPAGGDHFLQADFHADHFTIMGQGMTEMAMRALTDNNLELWVRNTSSDGARLRGAPILEAERIEFDLAYVADNLGFKFSLRRP